jgi:hypothetical protein
LVVDDVRLAAPDDVVVIVVPRLGIGADPRQAESHLARRQLVIDLPDREVRIASTRSSAVGADLARIDPEHANRDRYKDRPVPEHGPTIARRVRDRDSSSWTSRGEPRRSASRRISETIYRRCRPKFRRGLLAAA